MKIKILIIGLFSMAPALAATPVLQPTIITLSRFSPDRVAAARSHFERRMYQIKRTTLAVLGGIGLGVVIKYGPGWYRAYKGPTEAEKKKIEEFEKLDARLQGALARLDAVESDAARATASAEVAAINGSIEAKYNYYAQKEGAKRPEAPQQQSGIIGTTLRNAALLGIAGLVLTSGQQVFRVCSGTMEEVFYLWVKGYEYWYSPLVEQLRALMNELRESFYQARKIAQQSNNDPQLLIARQQRRGAVSYEISTHYRLDIVTMYQRIVSTFERLVALMFIMSPIDHHPVMQQHIVSIAVKLNRVSELLECDLNENTHGMLTLYSNATLDAYYECVEAITIFQSTYSTYLQR